jgi:hypothetical protein
MIKRTPPLEVRECRCKTLFRAPYWSDREKCDQCLGVEPLREDAQGAPAAPRCAK